MHRARRATLAAAVVAVLLLAACGPGVSTASGGAAGATVGVGNPSTPVTLQEAGSSTMYPYLEVLASPLRQKYPSITLSASAGGSGAGQSEAIAGTIDVGASDVYLSPAQFHATPGILNVPISVSSLVVTFNLKGISSLNLTGGVLAEIYMGRITRWNDPALAALNPGVKLPDQTVVPIRRVDSAGDTFDLTEFLSTTSGAWASGPAEGLTVAWPAVSGELAENGDPGMISGMSNTPGSIGYLGVSYAAQGLQAGLGEAALRNRAGHFVKSDQTTVESAVAQVARLPGNLVASLVDQPGGDSYPIVSSDYLIVRSRQSDPEKAVALRTFLDWAISRTGGATEANLYAVGFQPLPGTALPRVKAAVGTIRAS